VDGPLARSMRLGKSDNHLHVNRLDRAPRAMLF
jgi:hypothetical protein